MILGIKTHPINPEAPVALNTRFGWMVNGESPGLRKNNPPRDLQYAAMRRGQQDLDQILVKFWEQEEPQAHPEAHSSSDVE